MPLPNLHRTVVHGLHPVNPLDWFGSIGSDRLPLILSSDKVRGNGLTNLFEAMTISCPACAAQMPDTGAFCPGCGRAMRAVERARGTVGVLPETLAGALDRKSV